MEEEEDVGEAAALKVHFTVFHIFSSCGALLVMVTLKSLHVT